MKQGQGMKTMTPAHRTTTQISAETILNKNEKLPPLGSSQSSYNLALYTTPACVRDLLRLTFCHEKQSRPWLARLWGPVGVQCATTEDTIVHLANTAEIVVDTLLPYY